MGIFSSIIDGMFNASNAELANAYSTLNMRETNQFNAEQAEIARQFSHDEAKLAYERELQADSTKYQRQVQDMVKAGLNPLLAAGAGAGSVHSSPGSTAAASGVTAGAHAASLASNFDLIQTFKALAEKKNIEAETDKTEAETKKTEAQTEGITLDNEIKSATKEAVVESKNLENQLSRARVTEINKGLDEADARIGKLIFETATESEKRSLISAQRILANAEARQIVEMLPYSKQLMLAKTEGERAAATLAAAHTAYQNHLIDDGYLDSFIKNMKASADSAEARAALDKIKAALRTGDYSKVGDIVRGNFAKDFMQDMTVLLDNLNPLNNIFK